MAIGSEEITKWMLLLVGSLCVTAIVIFMSWIDYKKNKDKKESRPDPIFKGVLWGLGIWAVMFILELVGIFEPGWNQEHFWVHIPIMVVLVSVCIWAVKRNEPMPERKLYAICLRKLEERFQAKIYIGKTNC